MFDKILFAKIGWAPLYEGEEGTGNHAEPNESESWYERFNFLPGPDGRYYGYVVPIGAHESPPNPTDKDGWLVIFVSRSAKGAPLVPVGWYKEATFVHGYQPRPEYASGSGFPLDRGQWQYTYAVSAEALNVHRIPVELRVQYPEVPVGSVFQRAYLYARDTDPKREGREYYSALAEQIVALNPEPLVDALGKPWSIKEVQATVADYFDMLRAELEGRPYNKTAHRNGLVKQLSNRSPQAVEFKHCNISAVLCDMGLTYISGYKPRGNYQDLLGETVEQYLVDYPGLRKEIVEVDANPVDAPPDGSKFVLATIEVPPPQPPERKPTSTGKPVKTDWAAVTAYSHKLGRQGEQFVLDLERRRLRDAGRTDLESKTEWVADTQGDGAGYDIRSFDETGAEILIEVKTTKGPEATAFYITANELRCSENRGAAYRLYRVFQFRNGPKLYRLRGPLTAALDLDAKVYSAVCKAPKTQRTQ